MNIFTLALRIYPSIPRNIKVAVQDDVWPGTGKERRRAREREEDVAGGPVYPN
jgi:hypothetical protein